MFNDDKLRLIMLCACIVESKVAGSKKEEAAKPAAKAAADPPTISGKLDDKVITKYQ